MKDRPTGIIRTLPSLYGDTSVGARRYRLALKELEAERISVVYIALPCVPRIDVLHLYLLVEGAIEVRLNIGGYENGEARRCWDNTIRQPKYWATCTLPLSRPEEPIRRRGFQGIRYTADLW